MIRPTTSSVSAAALSALIVLTMGCSSPPPPIPAPSDAAIPRHDFIASAAPEGTRLDCMLEATEGSLTDLLDQPPVPCTLDEGWSGPETWGAWALGHRSRISFLLGSASWDRLVLKCKAYDYLPAEVEQRVEVAVNGSVIGRAAVLRKWQEIALDLPPDTLHRGTNEVELRFEHSRSPRQAGRHEDSRQLAANVASVSLVRSSSEPGPDTVSPTTQIFDRASGRFVVDRAGTLVLPVRVPAGAKELLVDIDLGRTIDSRRTEISAVVVSLDGRSVRHNLPIGTPPGLGGGRLVRSIPVDPSTTGRSCLLTFEVDPQPAGAAAAFAPPRFEPSVEEDGVTNRTERPLAASRRQPDIVLITLDAARPDHFSGYGYQRQTTPQIDRFAKQALVFENAFALAPYTLCSVPTMITGLSFIDHGVVSRRDVLAPDAVTLAESLQSAGYLTAAFSAMPNNSEGRGSAQGYDAFDELWKSLPRGTARDPHVVTRRVVEWLDSIDDSRPIHLQVHYIPPHAPYAPAPQFDRFADTGYSGPCDGGNTTLGHIESGLVPVDEGCLEQVIGLYDGNLLAVDDAVGRLLDTLRARPRWRDTVVLITSDHGEAFLEPGRMTHNSTVHDEMLRVPFILGVPDWIDTASFDKERLVTLADIVPTLLAAASIPAEGPFDGFDLLAGPDHPWFGHMDYFIAQTTQKPPVFGLRSLGWKAVLKPDGQGALFDLAADPGELHNLVFEMPALHRGLARMLADRVEQPRRVAPSGDTSEITDEDREMLEALGYVE